MIQFSSFNPQGFAFRSAQITIGGKTIGGFAVQSIPPNSLKSTNTMDIVDISPFARALSQSAVTQSEKYGNMTIPKDGRRIIPVRIVSGVSMTVILLFVALFVLLLCEWTSQQQYKGRVD